MSWTSHIQNPQEFSWFLESGRFQRQHMSSLLSQVFDPAFIFNTIYHNVAKLINRRILTSYQKPLTMTQKVPGCHFPILEKLSQLFFETQKLSTTRYALLPDTPMTNLKNYIIWFADRLLNFSMSCIYLVSCDTQSPRSWTSLKAGGQYKNQSNWGLHTR